MSSKSAAGRATAEMFRAILSFLKDNVDASRSEIIDAVPGCGKQLWYMQRKGYLKRFGVSYELTSKGEHMLNEKEIWKLQIPKPKKWDGKWYLVMFDIPVDERRRRDAFRLRLKEMGLVLYQNSVWVYPYPLEKIVGSVSDFYLLSGCVSFITATSLTGEERLRKHFRLG